MQMSYSISPTLSSQYTKMARVWRTQLKRLREHNTPTAIYDELRSFQLWLELTVEVLLSGIMLFAILALFVKWDNRPPVSIPQAGLAVAIIVSMLLEVSWHWGEVHLNGAVSLGQFLTGSASITASKYSIGYR